MYNTAYRVNDSQIVAELFDNEAIVMNLNDGVYFTLSGTAAEIWSLIEAGLDAKSMVAWLTARHDVDAPQCRADLSALLEELVRNAVILESDAIQSSEPSEGTFGPYSKPELTRHDDMSEVLAMDPPLPELSVANARNS